jgi:FtsP/CotA-like multicopper oxidase with cupredoxin domain
MIAKQGPRFSRRRFLAGAGTAALLPVLPAAARAAAATQVLAVERRTIEVKGKPAAVFRVGAPGGAPGLALDPGERFRLTLENRLAEPTIVHWHGQTPPAAEDGVAETGYVAPLAAGASRDYDFAARPGTHWMHSHQGLQEQQLLAGPLVVRRPEDLRLDAQEVTVLLHDFTFQDPAAILAGLGSGSGGMAGMAGHGMPPMSGAMQGQGMQGQGMPGMSHDKMAMPGKPAAAGPDLNDVQYDAFLANDRTLDDPEVVRVERSGRVRLRLINGGAGTAFWVDLGGAEATVLAVDGNPVAPLRVGRVPLAQAQRVDLLVEVPAGAVVPVLAQGEGRQERTGLLLAAPGAAVSRMATATAASAPPLDLSLERRLAAVEALPPGPTAVTHRMRLTGTMAPYGWGIDGRGWADRRPLRVTRGQRVVIEMANQTPMAHPMHLHGHHFHVVALDGERLAGGLRDTILVPPLGTVQVAFDADNPGRWLLHCHNLYHMATGMITELVYEGVA